MYEKINSDTYTPIIRRPRFTCMDSVILIADALFTKPTLENKLRKKKKSVYILRRRVRSRPKYIYRERGKERVCNWFCALERSSFMGQIMQSSYKKLN